MAESAILQTTADKMYERESELMQRFVRINLEGSEVPSSASGEEARKTGDGEEETPPKKIHPSLVAQEIKKTRSRKRRRTRSRQQEEIYTDKDRAAAVNMGNKDIKQSLKLKRKEDRSRNLLIPEEAEPGTFLALGDYEMKRGDLRIAMNFINKVRVNVLQEKPFECVKQGTFVAESVQNPLGVLKSRNCTLIHNRSVQKVKQLLGRDCSEL